MTSIKTLGIFGGTFDPIHFGHLRIALEMAEYLQIEKVHVIPSYQPVHREPTIGDASHRFEMVKLAIQNNPLFVADAREILRQSPSYTIDTLLELRAEYPQTTLCLFLGYDAFLGFHTWRRHLEILELAHLIVAKRPNTEPPESGPIFELTSRYSQKNIDYIQAHNSGGIFFLPTHEIDISAKEIRKLIAMGRNPRYLLPENVFHYIQLNGIYKP